MRELTHVLRRATIDSMFEFLDKRDLRLWGGEQPPEYLRTSLELTLYHDCFNVGYDALAPRVKRWYEKIQGVPPPQRAANSP